MILSQNKTLSGFYCWADPYYIARFFFSNIFFSLGGAAKSLIKLTMFEFY